MAAAVRSPGRERHLLGNEHSRRLPAADSRVFLMAFGTAVVTTRTLTKTGTPDELGNYTLVPIDVAYEGCRHRPLTFRETAELQFDVATEYWRTTMPLCDYSAGQVAALKAVPANAIVSVHGQPYQIEGGLRPFDDMEGNPFKATIISQKHIG